MDQALTVGNFVAFIAVVGGLAILLVIVFAVLAFIAKGFSQ